MANVLKGLSFCLLAQMILVAKARLAPAYFGNSGVLALSAIASLGAGALILAVRWSQLSGFLKPKALGLAALAAVFGVVLAETFSLAARDSATPALVQLAVYAIPLAAVLVALATKAEALDKIKVVAVVAGVAAVAFGVAGEGVLAEVNGTSLGYLLGAAVATACFLAAGQRLVAASSVTFAVATVLLLGGGATGYLAYDQLPTAFAEATSSTDGSLSFLVYAAVGLAAAYALLFAALARLKVSTVGASFLLAAPCSAAYLILVQGATIPVAAVAGAGAALVAFGVVAARETST